MIEIGSRNNAPTPQHKSHDVYLFSIDLSQPATPFCFEQSIGGGHAEQGGARWLALDELDAWPGQCREHLKKLIVPGSSSCLMPILIPIRRRWCR